MRIREILSATANVAGALNPALAAAIGVVNGLLPKDQRLPLTATGSMVSASAEGTLDPEQLSELLDREIDVRVSDNESWVDIQQSHNEADAKGSSTRPLIAMMMACTVCGSTVPLALSLAYAVATGNTQLIGFIDMAVFPILALVGTPTVLLRAYFGMRTSEKKARYAASVGQDINTSMISGILGTLKGNR